MEGLMGAVDKIIDKAQNEDEMNRLCQILEARLEKHWDSLDHPRVQHEDARAATMEKLVNAINTVRLDKAASSSVK
jgi:hypothetical protein